MDKEFFTNHCIELEKQKITCKCGGKYNNHRKEQHMETQKHKKYEKSLKSILLVNDINYVNQQNNVKHDNKKNISSSYGMGGWMDRT